MAKSCWRREFRSLLDDMSGSWRHDKSMKRLLTIANSTISSQRLSRASFDAATDRTVDGAFNDDLCNERTPNKQRPKKAGVEGDTKWNQNLRQRRRCSTKRNGSLRTTESFERYANFARRTDDSAKLRKKSKNKQGIIRVRVTRRTIVLTAA